MLEPTRAFKISRGLWNDSGPGLIGLMAYEVRAKHQARAHVPALLFTVALIATLSDTTSSHLRYEVFTKTLIKSSLDSTLSN